MLANLSQFLYIFNGWAILALRLIFGVILIVHGFPKIKNLKGTAIHFSQIGFKPGLFWGPLVAIVEFFGGIALILGLYTQIVALLVLIQFIVIIIWKIIRKQKFIGNLEFDALILASSLLLLTQGAGVFSLSHFFFLNY